MSEYELASLHTQMFGLIFSANVALFGVVSAFMVASFLAAQRLNRTMAFLAVFLFALYASGALIANGAVGENFMRLSKYMHDYAASGRGLSWHVTSQARSLELRQIAYAFTMGSMVLSHLAAIFFFYCRHVNGKLAKASEALTENRSPA